jgi:hypothetical protein
VVWLKGLLLELGLKVPIPVLWCDNLGTTFLASNPDFHTRTKHIELDFHFVREKEMDGTIQVRFICPQDQLADVLTKPLSSTRFKLLRDKLTVSCSTLRLRGAVSIDIQDKNETKVIQRTTIQEVI